MVDRAWLAAVLSEGPRFSTLVVAGEHHLDASVFEDVVRPATEGQGALVLLAEEASPSWSAVVDRDRGARWRVAIGSRIDVFDGATHWWFDGKRVLRREAQPDVEVRPSLTVLSPGATMGRFAFDEPAPVRFLDRDCVSVVGRQIPTARIRPDDLGDAVRLVVDTATGLILRWQSWFNGRDLSDMSVHQLVVDEPIDDDSFTMEVPDGTTVETVPAPEPRRHREQRRSASSAVRAGDDMVEVLDDYVPRSDPPTDQPGAEAQIRQTVAGLSELSSDGLDAINVQGGAGLGVAFAAASERFRDQLPAPIEYRVVALRYLADDEAVVLIHLHGAPGQVIIEGRVVHQDGRWLVERRTATSLLRRAGVAIPPPPH